AGGTVVQVAQSDLPEAERRRGTSEMAETLGQFGPMQWWPDPPDVASDTARLERVVVTTEDIERTITLYENLLGGTTASYGDGWVDLQWRAGGTLRIEIAAGRTEGVDRIECRRTGPPAELNVCGARFVVYSA